MPVVRVNVAQAEHLETEYNRAATTIDATIGDLSALLAEASWLLDQQSSPMYGPLPSLQETADALRRDRDDLAWRVDWLQTTDAADVYNGTSKPVPVGFTKTFEEPSTWDNFRHNILEGNSVVGALATRRVSPEVTRTIFNNAGHFVETIDGAGSQIRSLNPNSIEGATLLLSDPGQFINNQRTFADGVADWTVDTAKLAAALTIASSPTYNDAWQQHTGTDMRGEVVTGLQTTAAIAAEDPDAFAAMMVDWEGLEEDPIRWAGNQAPEVVIEVLTAGSVTSTIGARRAANALAEAADAVDDIPAPLGPRVADEASAGEQVDDVVGVETPLNNLSVAEQTVSPPGWNQRVADNGKGVVIQRPGAAGNADMVRVMEPTSRYPDGYARFYNSHGQPIGLNGKPGPRADTHIPIEADGSLQLPEGWHS